jgi:hypothetical protein
MIQINIHNFAIKYKEVSMDVTYMPTFFHSNRKKSNGMMVSKSSNCDTSINRHEK